MGHKGNYWNFPKFDFTKGKIQSAPTKINTKRTTSRNSITKLLKTQDGDKILKKAKGKQYITYNGTMKQITGDF